MSSSEFCSAYLQTGGRLPSTELSPVEVTEAMLGRIENLNPALNALSSDSERAEWRPAGREELARHGSRLYRRAVA
jgi:Asp-tRNA(Asn)/Glu-tRNA(Gln) amidotransferase A subunit family amidase